MRQQLTNTQKRRHRQPQGELRGDALGRGLCSGVGARLICARVARRLARCLAGAGCSQQSHQPELGSHFWGPGLCLGYRLPLPIGRKRGCLSTCKHFGAPTLSQSPTFPSGLLGAHVREQRRERPTGSWVILSDLTPSPFSASFHKSDPVLANGSPQVKTRRVAFLSTFTSFTPFPS